MPATNCFSYPGNMPSGAGSRGSAQPPQPGARRMPYACYSYPSMCFSYPDDMPWGIRDRNAAQPPLPGLRRMPFPCFRY